jgi:predicted SnoaL-like aldol condensation-catalyzing enzyme
MENIVRTLAIALLACLATDAPAAAADLEANKLLVRGYIEEVFNKHQPETSDRFVATDFIEHNPRLPHDGLAGAKQFLIKVFAAFSDYHGEIQNLVAEGDMVISRTQWTGTGRSPARQFSFGRIEQPCGTHGKWPTVPIRFPCLTWPSLRCCFMSAFALDF